MAFNTLQYAFFFVVVFLLYWSTARFAKIGRLILLIASLIFYASWRREYLLLLLSTAAVDFFASALISKTERVRVRKWVLAASVVYNLGVLCLFKYLEFLIAQCEALEGLFHFQFPFEMPHLELVLPVGISFFMFQSMSYTIDVYRKQIEPVESFPRYLLYVSFFPQLVAGPIVRAKDFLPQFEQQPKLSNEDAARAFLLIGVGLFKKMALADYLALNLVDRAFSMPAGFSSLEILASIYGYAVQIFCDFSGYSDVAIGSALLLGFQFPKNFDQPYRARNLQDFWRRWHISLSTWLRDNLYISLGGNRKGRIRTYFNLILTMLLGGLWHGAGWNFILWGALHGVGQAFQRVIHGLLKGKLLFPGRIGQALAIFLTFHFVCIAWVFFRCPDLNAAIDLFDRLADLSFDVSHLNLALVLCLCLGFCFQFFPSSWFGKGCALLARVHPLLQGLLIALVGLLLRYLAAADVVAFIYFQF